jgi:hypothetical protein
MEGDLKWLRDLALELKLVEVLDSLSGSLNLKENDEK